MAATSLLERLDGIEGRFEEVGTLITDPNVISDQKRYVKLTKEYHDLELIVNATRKYRQLLSNIEEAHEVLNSESDEEMRALAKEAFGLTNPNGEELRQTMAALVILDLWRVAIEETRYKNVKTEAGKKRVEKKYRHYVKLVSLPRITTLVNEDGTIAAATDSELELHLHPLLKTGVRQKAAIQNGKEKEWIVAPMAQFIPYELYEEKSIRRYGFHGTSHRYIWRATKEFLGDDVHKLVSCHLGSGASLAGIVDGQDMDTTMGLTPLDGLIMGTRCGTIDPATVCYLVREGGYTHNLKS